ncbi:FKBP-type peptidyl-prolyl cis-trans isomerase [Tenacibaculum amylolyticum]|uniref:FKBP-type peptidyl-prolyl cis-trans isomerase n=1 Tax=Tenacibaculum amylolyticum TaxID=104269 RepID=UPI0038949CC4
MKLSKYVAIAALGVSVVSCGKQLERKTSLETELDSVSYALGLNTASRMQADPNAKELNEDLYVQGFYDGVDSTNMLIDVNESTNIIRQYFQKMQMEQMKKREEEMKAKTEAEYKDYKKENEAYLEENKGKPNVVTTDSGLQYIVEKEGTGEAPKLTDKVKVHYHGTLPDGTVFDSSVDRGEPSEFGVNQVIKGWTEGLQLMKPGAKYKFFIPQELAYGFQGRLPKIKPYSALVFDVELLDVVPAAQPAAPANK